MMPVPRQAVFALLCAASIVTPAPILAQPEPDTSTTLDPSSGLDAMPDLGVDWPDPTASDPSIVDEKAFALPAESTAPAEPVVAGSPPKAVEPATPQQPSVDAEKQQRYSVSLEGLDALEGSDASNIRTRFESLSTLRQEKGSAANTAQINRRAHEDERMLREILSSEGYYDSNVSTRIRNTGGQLAVILAVEPGTQYKFTSVKLEGLEKMGNEQGAAREAFGIKEGDAVDADKVLAGVARLRAELGNRGFPFAKVAEPAVVVDHQEKNATLTLAVDAGDAARFGKIQVSGTRRPFGVKHISKMARFKPGDVYNSADIEDLRRALVATGLVSTVTLTPVKTADSSVVDIQVAIVRAPPRTIAGELGYGTGEGLRAEISWTHRNLIRPEGAVTFRGVAGTREQFLGASLRRSNITNRDWILTAQVAASHVNRDAYDAKTFTLSGALERQTNIIWQKKWTWSAGTELLISDERDTIASTGQSRRRTFYIAAAPGTLTYDGSDDLLNPTKGFRLAGRLSPEVSFHSGTFTYARAQIDASVYQPVGGRTVLAARIRAGSIAGAQRDEIAPSRRYYAGGGGSVRGYSYQGIGPRDVNNDPIGGRSVAEFSLEARIRFGDFGIVPFFDGGNIYTSPLPRFTGMRYGTGIGARYYTSFGPIRVDVGTPLNRRPGDSRIAVYVSLGQAF